MVGSDGYCENCGMLAPRERDHYTEHPAAWVAACCDRGIRHHRNEDASAVSAEQSPGTRAVLVVCDGVSTSEDSDVASLAARAAPGTCRPGTSDGLGTEASRAAARSRRGGGGRRGERRGCRHTSNDSANAASCTFTAAVVETGQVSFANVGDSRVYWLPDSKVSPIELSVDDSVAQIRIAMGVVREEAENGPHAHAITKWLGRDSPDIVPRTGSMTLTGPGWVLVCSDGLWNYASEAAVLQGVVARLDTGGSDPLALAESLVRWACERGGKDNISVALARH